MAMGHTLPSARSLLLLLIVLLVLAMPTQGLAMPRKKLALITGMKIAPIIIIAITKFKSPSTLWCTYYVTYIIHQTNFYLHTRLLSLYHSVKAEIRASVKK
jgi:hypothetical protein